jgi:microcystin-dependent protein
MTEPFVAEIRAFGFNFAPLNWATCAGQQIQISQNNTLFMLLGTTYGGDGVTNFNLPNLQDLTTVGVGQGPSLRNWPLGATFGEENHTLLITEVPQHFHNLMAATATPENETNPPSLTSYPGELTKARTYSTTSTTTLAPMTISTEGSSLPHNNIQPVLALNFCISLFGIFPPRS